MDDSDSDSISIENSKNYKQLQKENEKLKQEIEEAKKYLIPKYSKKDFNSPLKDIIKAKKLSINC